MQFTSNAPALLLLYLEQSARELRHPLAIRAGPLAQLVQPQRERQKGCHVGDCLHVDGVKCIGQPRSQIERAGHPAGKAQRHAQIGAQACISHRPQRRQPLAGSLQVIHPIRLALPKLLGRRPVPRQGRCQDRCVRATAGAESNPLNWFAAPRLQPRDRGAGAPRYVGYCSEGQPG